MGLAGETAELLLGTRRDPDGRADPEARGDGGRHRPGTLGRPAHPRRGHRRVGAGGARAAPDLRRGDPRPGGRERPRRRTAASAPAPVPIWIAALGPKATRLAGEIADGVILNWCTPERVAEARDAIRAAAGEAGRDPDAVTISVYVRGVVLRPRGRGAPGGRRPSTPRTRPTRVSSRRWASSRPPRRSWTPCASVATRRRAKDRLEAYRQAGADLPGRLSGPGSRRRSRGLVRRRSNRSRPDPCRASAPAVDSVRKVGTVEKG